MKTNKKYEEFFKKFKKHDEDWREHLSDSTYYELKDFYANETGQPFDDDSGYPNDVDNFATYIWKKYIQPPVSIVGKVLRRDMAEGIIQLSIKTSHKWCAFETGRKVEERSLSIILSADDFGGDESLYRIPMGEGFNYHNYICTSSQHKDQIRIVLIPTKIMINWNTTEIEPKEITED